MGLRTAVNESWRRCQGNRADNAVWLLHRAAVQDALSWYRDNLRENLFSIPGEGGGPNPAGVRVHRQRLPGWRMPPGAVYVGRPGPWGNPFTAGHRVPGTSPVGAGQMVRSPRHAVDLYAQWLRACPDLVERARAELAGTDLACWCPPGRPCHADVLLRVAAGGDP
ncbi:MAG TPA: DUF4326 domain-containing protein [Micromonosporaceae bacterium]